LIIGANPAGVNSPQRSILKDQPTFQPPTITPTNRCGQKSTTEGKNMQDELTVTVDLNKSPRELWTNPNNPFMKVDDVNGRRWNNG
jgi:hypothetical protein